MGVASQQTDLLLALITEQLGLIQNMHVQALKALMRFQQINL